MEQDIPLLSVNIPETVVNSKINKNDDIEVSIKYDGNPDNAFYSLVLIYKFDIVASKSFYYT